MTTALVPDSDVIDAEFEVQSSGPPKNLIVARMMRDPYSGTFSISEGNFIPIIQYSDHPRFRVGSRFDYGFLQVAIAQGYAVLIFPNEEQPNHYNEDYETPKPYQPREKNAS